MYEHATLSIRGSAEPEHIAAIRAFTRLSLDDLEPALNVYASIDETPPAADISKRALRVISKLFNTSADQYIDFGARVDETTRPLEDIWRATNLSSSSSAEADIAAKRQWRLARVATYIQLTKSSAVTYSVPDNLAA